MPTATASALQRGVLGAVLAFLVLGTLHALVIPPYLPDDEPAHVGYALIVRAGELPTIDTPIPRGWSPTMDAAVEHNVARYGTHRGEIHTANHPPLLYALVAAPLAVGERRGDPEAGLRLARVMSVALASGTVLAVAALATQLLPGHPLAVCTAAWFTALLPLMAHVSGSVYTDGLAVATFSAALAASAWLVRQGWSGGRVALAALAAVLAASSRASGLAAAGAVVLAAGLAGALTGGTHGRRLARAAAGAGAVSAAVVAAAGWFYMRNTVLYGDLSGASGLMAHLGRAPPSLPLGPLRAGTTWVLWTRDYFDGFAAGTKPFHDSAWRPVTWVVIALLAATVVWFVVRTLSRRPRPTLRATLPWLPPAAAVVVLCAGIVRFIALGGGLHPRYALAGVGLAATILGCAVAGLPGRRLGLPTLAMVAALLVLHVAALLGFAARTAAVDGPARSVEAALVALADAGVPPLPAATLAAAGLVAALGLLVCALATSGPGSPRR